MNKKILILYASIGLGHKSIAENIAYYLERAGFEVVLEDAQKVQGGWLVRWGTGLYGIFLGWMPFVWSWLYSTEWFISLTLPYRYKVAAKNYQQTLNIISDFKPDVIVTTHTTASGIVAYLKQQKLFTGKFGIAFSDFHLHRYWLYDQADFYLANTEEQKEEMMELGINANKVFVCGIVLQPKADVNIEEVKNKLDVRAGDKVALIASGSQGTGVDEKLISEFVGRTNIKAIVLCGKNKSLFESLSEKFVGSNISILSYHTPMDELYAIADIFITKPGGLSTAEALRWHLPILVSHLLPGQEEKNYGYLLDKNLVMPEPFNIVSAALEELDSGSFKKILAKNPELTALLHGEGVVVEAVNKALG